MSRVIDRFDKYMDFKGLNDNSVTSDLSLSVGLIGKSRKENRDLSSKVVRKILDKYNDINKVWLLTGEGEMLRTNHTITANIKGDGNTQVVGGGNASVGNGGVSSTKLIKELQDRILQLEGELKAKDDIIKMILSK